MCTNASNGGLDGMVILTYTVLEFGYLNSL